jgi:membrane protein YdbS with pleckstrin-like domain
MSDNPPLPSAQPPTKPGTGAERFRDSVSAKGDPTAEETESDVWQGGYSPMAMVGTWLLVALISVALIFGTFYVQALTWQITLGAMIVIWLIVAAIYAYRRLGYHYRLTTQRFVHQTGILYLQTDRIEVIDIDDVVLRQGPIERLFGIGTVTIEGSDKTHPQLKMVGIGDVRRVAQMVDDVRRKERRKRSVHIESI